MHKSLVQCQAEPNKYVKFDTGSGLIDLKGTVAHSSSSLIYHLLISLASFSVCTRVQVQLHY